MKLLTRLRFVLSRLCEQKFKQSFYNYLTPICTCGNEIETTTYDLLQSPINANERTNERMPLLNNIRNIITSILKQNDTIITKDFLFGNISLDDISDTLILIATIDYLISTKRFLVCNNFTSAEKRIIFDDEIWL